MQMRKEAMLDMLAAPAWAQPSMFLALDFGHDWPTYTSTAGCKGFEIKELLSKLCCLLALSFSMACCLTGQAILNKHTRRKCKANVGSLVDSFDTVKSDHCV